MSLVLVSPTWCVAMVLLSARWPFRAFSLRIFLVIGLPHWTTARCFCWFSLPDDVNSSEHVSRDSSERSSLVSSGRSPLFLFLDSHHWCSRHLICQRTLPVALAVAGGFGVLPPPFSSRERRFQFCTAHLHAELLNVSW